MLIEFFLFLFQNHRLHILNPILDKETLESHKQSIKTRMHALKTARAYLSKDASDLTQAVKKEILHLQQSLTITPQ
jgi:hypothetical protein